MRSKDCSGRCVHYVVVILCLREAREHLSKVVECPNVRGASQRR